MHKLPLALTTSVLAASALAVSALPAAASNPANSACVTPAEFSKVVHGMTVAKVASIFGTNGHQTMKLHAFSVREYAPCSPLSYVSVTFSNGRETDKSSM
jgi:hypothetical protein